jgi:hypothetical protein
MFAGNRLCRRSVAIAISAAHPCCFPFHPPQYGGVPIAAQHSLREEISSGFRDLTAGRRVNALTAERGYEFIQNSPDRM